MALFLFILVGAFLGAIVWAVAVVRQNRRRQRAIDRRELAEWAPIPRTRLSDSRRHDAHDSDGDRP